MSVWYMKCSERVSNVGNVDSTSCNLYVLLQWDKNIGTLHKSLYVFVHTSQAWFINHLLVNIVSNESCR
jgi:hypothetical protein